MTQAELQGIADYMMPAFPPRRSDLGFLFGTRHGLPESALILETLAANTGENVDGVPAERWHEHETFRARVLAEFEKIPRYLNAGSLAEITGCAPYPTLGL